jgi:adenylate kinase
MTAALLPFYAAKGLLRRLDGVGKPEEVTQRVLSTLGRSTGSDEAGSGGAMRSPGGA